MGGRGAVCARRTGRRTGRRPAAGTGAGRRRGPTGTSNSRDGGDTSSIGPLRRRRLMVKPDSAIAKALAAPSGARYYKCALQVNPFDYVVEHQKSKRWTTEKDYNDAIVGACKAHGIEVIGITDHYRVKSGARLREAAKAAGIVAFPGFEAVTKDGVHVLCLADPSTPLEDLDRYIGDCGVYGSGGGSPVGKLDVDELLQQAAKAWNCVTIAAHVTSAGGLLVVLKGQPAIKAWSSPHLLACSIPGEIDGTPVNFRQILSNKNPDYRRDHAVAVLNAQDVSEPERLADGAASCWIKMSEVTVDGLRQAFLDPGSRVRLATDPVLEQHVELTAMAWESGFLDGQSIHFNENLNVLIGGRGAGKSTVIESLRYVLGLAPVGDDAKSAHEGIVRNVLRPGTRIGLVVRVWRPAPKTFLIERTVPNPAVVKDENDQVLALAPVDIVPRAEVYGQHEISELAKSEEKLTHLLHRFVVADPELDRKRVRVRDALRKSRATLMGLSDEWKRVNDKLDALPGVEATLKQYEDAGLEERLKEQMVLVREEAILKRIKEKIDGLAEVREKLGDVLPVDSTFLVPSALKELPGKAILGEGLAVLQAMNGDATKSEAALEKVIQTARNKYEAIAAKWSERKAKVEEDYQTILRELKKASADAEEFLRLRKRVEELRPLRVKRSEIEEQVTKLEGERRNLLDEWEQVRRDEFQTLQRAAQSVNKQLAGRVRASVGFGGNREPLGELLRQSVSGRLSEAIDLLGRQRDLSAAALAQKIEEGAEALQTTYGIPKGQAEKLAAISMDGLMQLQELDLGSTTKLELNVAPDDQPESWQALKDLSKGQKATAVLLLLLLQSDSPLVVDQPEDDLDNRFVTEGVVPKMREEKRRRQFVFSSHNANIPVLGDAEQIIGLHATGEATGRAVIAPDKVGSIDKRDVRLLVEELLEGGRVAFETRRRKYRF